MDDDPLTEWRDMLLARYFDLDDEELLDDVTLDFTAASLRGLETYAQQLDFDDEESVLAVAAYLGETLMRAGGGCWAWIDELPLVRPDDTLGLAPIRPVQLVEEAGDRSFESVHAEWAAAAARVAAERPGWRPVKEETDLDLLDDHENALTRWLAARESAFVGGTGFDFSPESLTTLEQMVRATAATEAQLRAPEHRELLDSAVWYYGEVLRRRLGGKWDCSLSGEFYATQVSLRCVGRSRGMVALAISIFIALRKPGYLRWKFDSFAEQ